MLHKQAGVTLGLDAPGGRIATMIAYFRSCLMDSRGYAAVTDARVYVIRGKRQGACNESGDKRSGIAICPVACHHLSKQSANGVPYPESIINVNKFEAGKRMLYGTTLLYGSPATSRADMKRWNKKMPESL